MVSSSIKQLIQHYHLRFNSRFPGGLQCFDTVGWAKKWVIRWWQLGYLSGARCKWFVYGPADATATSSSLGSLKSTPVEPFWCQLSGVVLERNRKGKEMERFNWCLSFQVNLGCPVPLWFSSFTCSRREPLALSDTLFVWARCPSCPSTNSVEALKETESTDFN